MSRHSVGNAKTDFSGIQKLLHWLIALLVLATIPIGLIVARMEFSPTQVLLITIHKGIGVTVLVLMVLRLIARLRLGAPPLPAAMPAYERWLAQISHPLLYILLIAMPLSGWAFSDAEGVAVSYFGFFELPSIAPEDDTVAAVAYYIHKFSGYGLIAVLAAHVAGALNHHIRHRDDVLLRMLPGKRARRAAANRRSPLFGLRR